MSKAEAFCVPSVSSRLCLISRAAYRLLGERRMVPENTELLYGFIYYKQPKLPYHSFLVTRLTTSLRAAVLMDAVVRIQQPIVCGDSEPEPDLAVVISCKGDFIEDHPHTAELVMEVSIMSHDYDRSKLRAYAAAGVRECWLVLGPEKQIEVYRQPVNGAFTETVIIGPGGSVASTTVTGLVVELDGLFAK